jgi:hypothetical protein
LKINDIAFGFTTCTRTEATADTSLKSFRVAFDADIVVHNDTELRGVVYSWQTLAQTLLWQKKPYLCIVQDDFTYTVHAREAVERIEFKEADGYYNLFTAQQPGIIDGLKDGWNAVMPLLEVWGAMWVLRSDTVERMLYCDKFIHLLGDRRTGLDFCVDKWIDDQRLTRYVHSPSLAIHIGRSSTMNHDFVETHGW